MEAESMIACLPSVVLMMRENSSFLIMSTMWGRPSITLLTRVQGTPASRMASQVPPVA